VSGASPVVEAEWLLEHVGEARVVPADCRFTLGQAERGERAYREGHIPGAVYLHLERDLSAPAGAHGGRHPLPEPGRFAERLGKCGIGPDSLVVAYDDAFGEMAGRLWWLLEAIGHPGGAAVLSGGLAAWLAAGGSLVAGGANRPARDYPSPAGYRGTADLAEVRRASGSGRLLDARAPERYRGEVEPIDPRAGHIPGARSFFWKEGLGPDGRFLAPAEQARRFSALPADQAPVVYCGSGVTACADILALRLAGRADALLYPGSFSDWVSYPDHPVATGAAP
jgi:thiosulfate/3-mercaptopyruvate sulfurtransferase